jgi:hypothetical protein
MRYFSSPGSPPPAMDSLKDTPKGVGCPIRRSRDHRALAPPPSFSQRATSFIASRCQGIHQMPFSCSPTPSPKAARSAAQRTEIREQRSDQTGLSALSPSVPGALRRIAPTRVSPGVLHTHARARPILRARPKPRRWILSCPLHGHDSLHDVKSTKPAPHAPCRSSRRADLLNPLGPATLGGPGPT